MLVLVIFAACLLAVQIGVEFFQYKLRGFFKFCLALVVTVVIWQGMHAAIVWHVNRTITHEYVLTELAKQGYYFNSDAEELLAPFTVSGYFPRRNGNQVLDICGNYCLQNYCNGKFQKVIYFNLTAGPWIEYYSGDCTNGKPTINLVIDKNLDILFPASYGFYPSNRTGQLYLGYFSKKLGVRVRVKGYIYNENIIEYHLYLDYRKSTWMKFVNFHHDSGQVFVRESGWPEFVNVGNTNEL